jgi:hypothetical protein
MGSKLNFPYTFSQRSPITNSTEVQQVINFRDEICRHVHFMLFMYKNDIQTNISVVRRQEKARP